MISLCINTFVAHVMLSAITSARHSQLVHALLSHSLTCEWSLVKFWGGITGKYMLAHAASAQGISAVENMCGREHVLDHNTVPAACFTHPEVQTYVPIASLATFIGIDH